MQHGYGKCGLHAEKRVEHGMLLPVQPGLPASEMFTATVRQCVRSESEQDQFGHRVCKRIHDGSMKFHRFHRLTARSAITYLRRCAAEIMIYAPLSDIRWRFAFRGQRQPPCLGLSLGHERGALHPGHAAKARVGM